MANAPAVSDYESRDAVARRLAESHDQVDRSIREIPWLWSPQEHHSEEVGLLPDRAYAIQARSDLASVSLLKIPRTAVAKFATAIA